LAGLLSIASSSFLVAITQREQVAQIFGRPVYVITDVAILPLSSQNEASRAIATAIESLATSETSTTDTDTDVSDTEANNSNPRDHPEPETPIDRKPPQKQTSNPTSIARDVIANRGQYGRFAAQWFSKQGWSGGKSTSVPAASQRDDHGESASPPAEADAAVAANQPQTSEDLETQEQDHEKDAEQLMSGASITEAVPKILRRTRMLLTSGSYFFSYEFDLTRRLATMGGKAEPPSRETLDPLVCSHYPIRK
jgi:hypothetical protein